MLLCTLTAATSDPVPYGTIAFFDPSVGRCPPSFMPFTQGEGRSLIGGYEDTGVVVSQTAPLASGEDRTHSHTYSFGLKVNDVSYAGVDGCCNNELSGSGVKPISGSVAASSSNVPYIQLLACVSQAATFDSNFPPTTLIFNEVSCPPKFNLTLDGAGRFIISNPENGVPGATVGGKSISPGGTNDPTHTHDFSGTVTTRSCEVGLASGCCADGYAAQGTYDYETTTDDNAVAFPYVSVPLCVQYGDLLKAKEMQAKARRPHA